MKKQRTEKDILADAYKVASPGTVKQITESKSLAEKNKIDFIKAQATAMGVPDLAKFPELIELASLLKLQNERNSIAKALEDQAKEWRS